MEEEGGCKGWEGGRKEWMEEEGGCKGWEGGRNGGRKREGVRIGRLVKGEMEKEECGYKMAEGNEWE